MCGIAGILTSREDLDFGGVLPRMQQALAHRGPDDCGIQQIALPNGLRLGLVHTRLSILDLSSAGRQPMCDETSQSWLVYNGEIYNHLDIRRTLTDQDFTSTSDTETLLKAWDELGTDAVGVLQGMFAFAIYDARRSELWLVRDRLGIKPLYVSRIDARTWAFASEVRALLATELVRRRLRPEAIDACLAFGAVPAPWTILDSVESVMPGEAWRFDLAKRSDRAGLVPEQVTYWRPEFSDKSSNGVTRREAVRELKPLLGDVAARHMLSDVPIGVFLSGGIDSSSLVSVLSDAGAQIHTFSVAFGECDYDESAHARNIARRFGTEHTELRLNPDEVLTQYRQAVSSYDQPSLDGLNTWFLAQAVRRAGIKVALSGLGGDELFAGYPNFRWAVRLDNPLIRRMISTLAPAAGWLPRPGHRLQKLKALAGDTRSGLPQYCILRQGMLTTHRQGLWAAPDAALDVALPEAVVTNLAAQAARLDPVNAYSLMELSVYLANTLLRDSDQMSMAHGLEIRVPFVDHRLVEFVARLPGPLKASRGMRRIPKRLLVESLPRPLPAGCIHRRKMGFTFPWDHWLRGPLHGCIADVMHDAPAIEAAGLRPAAVRRLWDDYCERRPGRRSTEFLCLVHLLSWVRNHAVSL